MKETQYVFDGVKVKIIDKSSHEERQKRLIQPLNEFYRKGKEQHGNFSRKTN